MEIKFTDEIINQEELKNYRTSKWKNVVDDFKASNKPTCEIDCRDNQERKICACGLREYIKRKDESLCVYTKGTKIYLIKC